MKKKLAVVSPMVLFGNSILYETGDDLDEDEQRSYAANAAKVRHPLSHLRGSRSGFSGQIGLEPSECL